MIPRTNTFHGVLLTLGALVALSVVHPADVAAQAGPAVKLPGLKAGPASGPTTGPAKAVERPAVKGLGKTKPGKRAPRGKAGLPAPPKAADGPRVPRMPRPGEGIERTGTIEKDAGKPLDFDPAKLGKKDDGAKGGDEKAEEGDELAIEDMIEFKSNFERGIKCRKLPLSTRISIDFEDAALIDVVKFIGCITAKNFIMGKALGKGKTITIMSPEPVTAYEAYKVFLTALEMNGLTVVPNGKFLKIVEIAKARQDTIPMLGPDRGVPNDSSLVTRVIELKHVDATELQQILAKFKSPHGDITVYAPTNTIFLTEVGTNLRKLLKLVKELDVPVGKERIWVRQIEYAEATAIVDKLNTVFGTSGSGSSKKKSTARKPTRRKARKGKVTSPTPTTVGEPTQVQVSKILADERTNQLIIVANATSYFKLDKLIRKLDVPIPGEGAIHIHRLENADAEELSQTLSSLVSGGSGSRRTTTKKKAKAKKGKSGAAQLFEGDVRITAYKPMNSLIIQASLKDYVSLKSVIGQLDTQQRQVYVEAIIMEVTSSKDRKFGLTASGGSTFQAGGETIPLLFASGGMGISGIDVSQLSKGGFAAGLQGPLVDVSAGSGTGEGLSGELSIPGFGFLLEAIQSNSDVNILSTPHILTLDNEEAEIQVGKQIPYQANSMGGLGGLAGLSGLSGLGRTGTSSLGSLGTLGMMSGMGGYGMVQRIDVDLTLKITPHISDSNYVKLETDLQIDDVESIDRTLGPTTSKRHVTNVVVVKDQQPVVIGGLIRDTESEAVDKVPFLGDIPLLGTLFRKTSTVVEKKNLVMIIIPHIIDDPATDLKRIHERKMEELRRYSEYMSTQQKEYLGEIDYERKHGAMEEMRQTVTRARKEREQLERSLFDETDLDTVGPPETHDIEYDPYKDAVPAEPETAPRHPGATRVVPTGDGATPVPPEPVL